MTWLGRGTRATLPLLALLCACSSGPGGPDPGAIDSVPGEIDPGTEVAVSAPAGVESLLQKLGEARRATADELRASHAVEFEPNLGYDPLTAANLDQVLSAFFSAPDAQKEHLSQTGFTISAGHSFPSFAAGYSTIYLADMPVFISSDMVLEAIYRSHDKILQQLEKKALRPQLASLLTDIRRSLLETADTLEPEVASDLNFYLGVAVSLLNGGKVDPREHSEVQSFVGAAMQAKGIQKRVLFGVQRSIDFSQFKPRGHYDGDPELESYFRAMMWLGRIDFRLIETQEDGSQRLRRRQVESAIALRRLLDASALEQYQSIDATISAFVGEHDYMTLEEVDDLLTALNAPNGIAAVDDATLAAAIVEGQFGQQRIASHVMRRNAGGASTFPLNLSFALFGQRYTVDSHVFSNLVYDRLPTRVVPDPLDVAFAALGNDQALGLLGDELDVEVGYPGELSAVRVLVDEHPEPYWEGSLYTNWLGALRALSPGAGAPAADLPAVARSEAWGRRLLNTQLSSWAQLRHNNVLYVKQSYTSNASCEYPDAYVDPYPEFFDAVVRFAERAQELTATINLEPGFRGEIQDYFARVARINLTLGEMARAQRSGQPHSKEHLAFINQAVTADVNCDGTVLGHTGWYSELHFDPLQAVEMDPAITDVHTDIGGDLPVPRPASVLHVGTGAPRLMVMTVDSCQGPRAYAGVVSAYHEVLEEGLVRLTDEEWKTRVYGDLPVVPWLAPLLSE
ncbi:hypothetical protein BE17_16035 [Sorangium cellulosum]|uniref:Secreted protein n=1 Tax=Sorangium cellulosum TaxID=56 RepID=A0A150QZX9_SORCE|nr:hypothetical protein BE17_16035 [Sorangium cellulosum]